MRHWSGYPRVIAICMLAACTGIVLLVHQATPASRATVLGATEYVLAVDAVTGILLSVEALIDTHVACRHALVDIEIDKPNNTIVALPA